MKFDGMVCGCFLPEINKKFFSIVKLTGDWPLMLINFAPILCYYAVFGRSNNNDLPPSCDFKIIIATINSEFSSLGLA